jgi:hypothetical protein
MAAATIDKTEYGFRCHTGTDATTVVSGRTGVDAFVFFPASNDATCTIKNTKGDTVMVIKGSTAGIAYPVDFKGKYLDGINVTHSAASSLLILVK